MLFAEIRVLRIHTSYRLTKKNLNTVQLIDMVSSPQNNFKGGLPILLLATITDDVLVYRNCKRKAQVTVYVTILQAV